MDLTRRCAYISNSYYNKGLRLANENDLSGAAECLKNALKFNKHNTDARNLLGLIYYRIGEVADALVQWVLSLNLQPVDNDADRYLNEVQRQSGLIESYSQAISGFNQTLSLSQGGSDDLAILQLSKITGNYKTYVRAHVLLGLLYLENGQNAKAYKSFQNALRIDRGEPLANRCIDYLKAVQRENQSKKSGFKGKTNAAKANEQQAYISSEPYRENTGWQTIVNIGIGLIIGAASILLIYMPVKEASISRKYNQQVIEISERLNASTTEIRNLNEEKEELQSKFDNVDSERADLEAQFSVKLSSFQCLSGAIKAMDNNDVVECAELFARINPDHIIDIADGSSASVEHYYKQLESYFNETGYNELVYKGNVEYDAGNYQSAVEYYDLSLTVKEDNPEAIYMKGMCSLQLGEQNTANELFDEVIEKYPNSDVYSKAKERRGA